MVLFYITWAPWKSWVLSVNMGQLTSSRSPHRGDLLSQSHKSCGDVHPPPGFASPLPPGTMGLSCQGARVRGHGIPPSCQIWGQIPRPLLHWAKSRSSLAPCNPSGESQQEEPQRDFFFKNSPFTAFFFSSFFFLFFFLFHIERDRTVWKINCTGLRVTCVRACERLCTGSLLDFTAVAFIPGTKAAT